MVACARFTGRTEKECTRRGWGCVCNEEKERAFHALRVEDIPCLADMLPSEAWEIFSAGWDAAKMTPNGEVRGASRLAGEASASTVVLAGTTGRKD